MAKRFIDTTIWTQNQWFRKLKPNSKLFWFYLISNCDNVGVWEEDWDLVSFIIGTAIHKDEIYADLNGKIKVLSDKKIWIIDFCKFQYGELSELSRPHKSFIKLLKHHDLFKYVGSVEESNTNQAIRQRLTQTKKEEILSRDKYQCQYCGEKYDEMVVDHIIPINSGGTNEDDNLITACAPCNSRKGELTLSEFYSKYNGSYKSLHRVSNILDTLKDKDKDKDKD